MFMMISFRGLLLLLSREFFIFQIADVHLLHSATWWRLLGQKYSLTAEVSRLRLRGERLAVWCGNEIEPRYLGGYNLAYPSASDGLGFLLRRGQCRQEDRCQDSNNGDDNEQFDQRKSLSPRLGFRERVSGSVFASRFYFLAWIILSAAEISSRVGACQRRTAQPPLARCLPSGEKATAETGAPCPWR